MTNTVKLERARISLSQQDLAEQVQVSRQTIHSIESGKFMPSYVLAIKISRVLNVPVEELFVVEEGD
jgi:putative transcriptional regulator